MDDDIEHFFEAYERRWARRWGPGPGRKDEPALDMLAKRYRLRRPVLRAADIARLGWSWPPVYQAFLCARSWQDLELEPWIHFPETDSKEELRPSIAPAFAPVKGKNLTPFAVGYELGDVFGFRNATDDSPVDLWSRSAIGSAPLDNVFASVFSSFHALLRVMTKIMSTDVVLYVPRKQSPSQELRDVVEELRAIDPDGFGRVGWPCWGRYIVGM
jgi:hypothetical protein